MCTTLTIYILTASRYTEYLCGGHACALAICVVQCIYKITSYIGSHPQCSYVVFVSALSGRPLGEQYIVRRRDVQQHYNQAI